MSPFDWFAAQVFDTVACSAHIRDWIGPVIARSETVHTIIYCLAVLGGLRWELAAVGSHRADRAEGFHWLFPAELNERMTSVLSRLQRAGSWSRGITTG